MISLLSPAKSLDFENQVDAPQTETRFDSETSKLIKTLRDKSENEIQDLMSISDKLATLNLERYQNFQTTKLPNHAKQAVFAFQGDVYQGLEADSLKKDELKFAQEHLRILSGLYGVLRPLDMIQPYRLEMGTKLKINGHDSLYSFWGDKIAKVIREDLKKQGDHLILNLASNEYFKAVDKKTLDAEIVEVEFKDFKNGKYKIISFYAKKARGMMARYMSVHKITKMDDLKGFDYGGYEYDDKESGTNKLVFKRDKKE